MAGKKRIPPPVPPSTPNERYNHAETMRIMLEISDRLLQQNLDLAVQLAIRAARRQGPLVDHFAELGRRFAHELAVKPRAGLRVVDGGRTPKATA